MAERSGRERERQAEKAPAPLDRTHGSDTSVSEADLPKPQFHTAQVPGLPDIPPLDQDRYLAPDLVAAAHLVRNGALTAAVPADLLAEVRP